MPEALEIPSVDDIRAARGRIAGRVFRTPLLYSPALSERTGGEIHLKMECWQRCGCFKVRGAVSMVSALSAQERARGLVTCSSGNHGLSLAYAAGLFGHPPTRVFVPEGAQPAKVRKILQYGAEVVTRGRHFLEAFDAAVEYTRESGSTFVHSHDHPLVIAGQGTIGLEILEDLPDVEAVLVPVGGGGLISGILTALKAANESIRVIGVESTAAPGAWLSFRDGRCHERIELKPSIADGLSGTLTPRTFAITHGKVEAVHLVDDGEIVRALRVFLEDEQLVLEGSAAVGLAALLAGKLDLRGRKAVLVLTGRNIRAEGYLDLVRG
jgi:threonine dehydratase